MLDRQTISIGAEMHDELSQWIAKRNNNITKQEKQAHDILLECGVPEHELRQLWVEQ